MAASGLGGGRSLPVSRIRSRPGRSPTTETNTEQASGFFRDGRIFLLTRFLPFRPMNFVLVSSPRLHWIEATEPLILILLDALILSRKSFGKVRNPEALRLGFASVLVRADVSTFAGAIAGRASAGSSTRMIADRKRMGRDSNQRCGALPGRLASDPSGDSRAEVVRQRFVPRAQPDRITPF